MRRRGPGHGHDRRAGELSTVLDPTLRSAAEAAIGFMPVAEGAALYEAALRAPAGPLLEVGTYCGKSAVLLGAAARRLGTVVFTVDHHRGSEENQPGELYHDPRLVDACGRVDTLSWFRRTIAAAALEDVVVAIVGRSEVVARFWGVPLGLAFIDGGHSEAAARADYEGWAPHVMLGGLLVIHDVFPDPADGGRPPYDVYVRAMASGAFEELVGAGSLRVLRRVAEGL